LKKKVCLLRKNTATADTLNFSEFETGFYFALEKLYVILLLKIQPTVKSGLKGFSKNFSISFQQGGNPCQARKYHHASPKCPEK